MKSPAPNPQHAFRPDQATADFIHDVCIFCLSHGGHLYRDWPASTIYRYLAFHFVSGGLIVLIEREEIAGVFIAWREFASWIEQRELKREHHFNWQLPPEGGDALMIGDVIIDTHGQNCRGTRTRLLAEASARWPDWKMRRLFTHRRGGSATGLKLVELSHAAIARLFHEQPVST